MAIITKRDTATSLKTQPEYYSDFLPDLAMHPVKKDILRYTNENAVKSSIRNLLLTNRGDRLFNDSIGSDIRGMLFEQPTMATEKTIQDLVRTTIENFEPRAKVLDVTTSLNEDVGSIAVTIVFALINSQEPVILEVMLDRIR